MKRSAIGHVATTLLREIGILLRISLGNREKTILIIEGVESVEWASLTFVGERHILDVRIDGEATAVAAALAAIVRDLPDVEVAIPGHFIAEIRAEPVPLAAATGACTASRALRVEALVLRD